MRITIIAVGKVKEKFYRDAIAEFEKRLSKYCKLDIVEVADEKTPDNASAAQELMIKAKEGDRILTAIKEDMYVIALAIEGKQLSSTELADKIDKLGISGKSSIAFVIDVYKRQGENESFCKYYSYLSSTDMSCSCCYYGHGNNIGCFS